MARTGTQFAKLTGDYSSINVYATWQLRKQDASTGESTIRLREYLTYSSNGTYGSSYSTFKLQNKTVKSGSYEYAGSGDYLLGYTDIVVKHNADGSFPDTTLKAYAYSYHFTNKPSKTATLTNKDIPNIQMISTITDISGSKELLEHTDSSSSVLISSNLLDNYVSTLSAVVDNIEYTILENITFSNLVVCFDQMVYEGMAGSDKPHIYIQDLDWKNLCNKIPNAKSIDITFRLTTFEDNTYSVELGQSDKVYTFEVNKADIDFEPFLKADNNTIALTGNDETFIQLISPFIMDSNVKALNNGATISEYGYGVQISYEDNQSYSTQYYRTEPTFAYEPINSSNVKTLRLYVSLIDSRGYTLISPSIFVPSEEYTLLRYVKPILENITIERPEQTAPYVHMNISGSFWKNNFGNVQNNLQLQYRYILNTDTQYTEWLNLTPTINDDWTFSFNGNVGTVQNPIVPTENSATFEIRAIDSTGFEVKEINFTIPKGKSMFDWAENYFSWNGELCIDDNEVPCFIEEETEADGSRIVQLYDSQMNPVFPNVKSDPGSSGTTNNYNDLVNKPTINNIILKGNLTTQDLNISYNDLKEKPTIPTVPTQVSSFTNDAGYLTSIPSEYITETELASKKYLTNVPSEYVTDSELNAKGYLTEHQPIKTVNGQTLIGSGDITIEGGSSVTELTSNFNVWELESGIYYVAPNVTMTNYTMFYDALSSLGVSADTSMSTITVQLAKAFLIVHNYFEGMGMVEFTLFMMGEAPTVISGMTMYQEGIAMGGTIIGGDFMLSNKLQNYQEKLVSGTNIKTVNGTSLLGSGNITIEGGTGGGGIETLTGSARLWNLSQGVYLIAPSTVIQYYGATGSSSFTLQGGGVLSISDGDGSYKGFQIVTAEGAEAYIYLGATSSTYGFYAKLSRVNLQNAKACTYASSQNAVGYYNSTGTVSNLNSTMYIQPNEWSITISKTTTGAPSDITGSTKVYISVKAPGFAGSGLSSSLMPYIRQDMYAPSLNKHWYRIVNYSDSSNVDYGEWIEVIESGSGTGSIELKTINDESLVGTGNIIIPLPAYSSATQTVGYATNGISEVFTDLNNLRMLAQGEYNFVIDSTTANAPTGVATTKAICIKTYRTRCSLEDKTLVPTLDIRQDLFMDNRHFYRMISHPNQSSFAIDDITFGNWIEILEKLDAIYPIGSVYISNTNSNPTEVFGGTWELIDKQFKSSYSSTDDTWFKPSGSNNTQSSNSYTRDGHSVRVRIVTKTAKSLTDTDADLGHIDLEKLGMQSILGTLNVICYINDDAVGIVAITFNTGELTWRGLIGEATNVASDASITIDAILETSSAYMLDEACDKFYWKRVS